MRYTVLSFLVFLLFGCLDEIDLEVPKAVEDGVVIRGELMKGNPSTIIVNVGRVFNFDVSTLSPFNARSVILIDESGNEIALKSTQDGVHNHTFSFSDPIQVEFGQQYKLRVSTFDNRTFESTFEALLPLPEATELKAEAAFTTVLDENGNQEERPGVQFTITTPLRTNGQERNSRLLWRAERTHRVTDSVLTGGFISKQCYITSQLDFNRIHVLDGTSIGGEEVQAFPLSRAPLDYRFAEGYYYTVYQRALTSGAFDYWDQTKQVIEKTGNLFEAPAGRIASNFENVEDTEDEVFGYFMAFAQDTIRLYVPPEQFDHPGKLCPLPPPPGGDCPAQECCDCALVEGSQIVRPEFWVE